MSTTRFPFGVNNSKKGKTLGNMGQLNPAAYATYFDDFIANASAAGSGGIKTAATTVAIATPQQSFKLTSGKQFFGKSYASLATVAANTLYLGVVDSLSAPTKGISIKVVGGTTLTLSILNTASTTATATVAASDGVLFSMGFELTRKGTLVGYFNDAAVCSITDMSNLDTTDNLLFGIIPTGATATVDYLLAAQER